MSSQSWCHAFVTFTRCVEGSILCKIDIDWDSWIYVCSRTWTRFPYFLKFLNSSGNSRIRMWVAEQDRNVSGRGKNRTCRGWNSSLYIFCLTKCTWISWIIPVVELSLSPITRLLTDGKTVSHSTRLSVLLHNVTFSTGPERKPKKMFRSNLIGTRSHPRLCSYLHSCYNKNDHCMRIKRVIKKVLTKKIDFIEIVGGTWIRKHFLPVPWKIL